MKSIKPAELQNLLVQGKNLTVLDVRAPVEFAEVHVPQAKNVPLDQLDPQSLFTSGQATKDQPIYLLCRAGGRATQAGEKLAKSDFDHSVVVEGGTLAWIEAGLPVNRSTVKVISLERQIRLVAGATVLTGVLLSLLLHPYFLGISAFVGAGLVFSGLTDWCGMGLLLAKMPWNRKA